MAKPSLPDSADLADVVQNPSFRNPITKSTAMKEAVTGSAPTGLLHTVLGAIMKDLAHIQYTFNDYKATRPSLSCSNGAKCRFILDGHTRQDELNLGAGPIEPPTPRTGSSILHLLSSSRRNQDHLVQRRRSTTKSKHIQRILEVTCLEHDHREVRSEPFAAHVFLYNVHSNTTRVSKQCSS